MQLFISTDAELGIPKKMATIKQEPPHELEAAVNLVEEIMNNIITNENKENVDKGDLVIDCAETLNNEKNTVDGTVMAETFNNDDESINETKEKNSHSTINLNSAVDCEAEEVNSADFVNSQGTGTGKSDQSSILNTKEIKQEPIEDITLNFVDDDGECSKYTIVLPSNAALSSKVVASEGVDKISCDNIKAVTENEVIDIAEETPEQEVNENKKFPLIDNLTENIVNNHTDSKYINDAEMKTSETNDSNSESDDSKNQLTEVSNIVQPVERSIIKIDNIEESDKIHIKENEIENIQEINKEENKSRSEITDHTKHELPVKSNCKKRPNLSLLSNLSNTLDILSDEEDEYLKKQESPNQTSAAINKCINIEDDDDIMLIDDEVISKDNESVTTDVSVLENESNVNAATVDLKVVYDINEGEQVETSGLLETKLLETEIAETKLDQEDSKKKDETVPKLPLLPVKFLEACNKNLSNMTHEELEEFCIIKIVESVIDRSNLGEIRSQLKTMVQKIEGYEKKVYMLTKQNRDLQLVLKSVQEEQKKNSGTVTPLKITRSVGMQVLMTDKNSRKRPIGLNNILNNQNTTSPPNRQNKPQPQTNQSSRNSKIPPTNQQIPVPRLVPAGNSNNTKNNGINSTQTTNNATKPQTTNNATNSVKTSTPVQKAEKRPHPKMQSNSATVDLTDDEPPTKVLTRNNSAPVRCVPPQNLLAPRPPLVQNMTSPRKVYIPIGGPQSQNVPIHKERTGHTVMFRSISPQTNRPRIPSPNVKTMQNTNNLRMGRVSFKHPAPLPDTMKQYQPPNWKALPPSPELKLSKVENGIVISWKIDGYQEECHEEIASYQLFAYQETSSPPSTSLWKKIGDVKALPLPMACTLTQFIAGFKYYFAVRAVDVKSRFGPFSKPGSILLYNTV